MSSKLCGVTKILQFIGFKETFRNKCIFFFLEKRAVFFSLLNQQAIKMRLKGYVVSDSFMVYDIPFISLHTQKR